MPDSERLIDILARTIFPAAFDQTAFAVRADLYTKPGDFERGQAIAKLKVEAALTAAEKAGVLIILAEDGR